LAFALERLVQSAAPFGVDWKRGELYLDFKQQHQFDNRNPPVVYSGHEATQEKQAQESRGKKPAFLMIRRPPRQEKILQTRWSEA
jgi:hypothetical protein